MARLADLSRQVNGQLDTRMAKLEKLLADADRKIENLGETGRGERGEGDDGGGAIAPLSMGVIWPRRFDRLLSRSWARVIRRPVEGRQGGRRCWNWLRRG